MGGCGQPIYLKAGHTVNRSVAMALFGSPRQQWCVRTNGSAARVAHRDQGVGLIEVILALFVLAIMSLGVLPLLVSSVKASAINRDLVAATSFANAKLSAIRATFPDIVESSCAAVTGQNATNVADPAGTGLKADVIVGVCPTSYPDAMTVRVRVRDPAANTLADLYTQIVVTQA